ncbi:MAG: GNAT family N-acetyltransferase [Bacteroidales bacterium]|jgi:ribosomal protein S18 acetylase RimI-like enzyme|nr:GNAT family N-acetyltransferase [Bacteroidales bacterium]
MEKETVIIKKLKVENAEEVVFVKKVYTEAFPEGERRDMEDMLRLYTLNEGFTILVIISDNGQLVGFLTYWDLGDFVYAEHFAISSEFRNGGYGKRVMEGFLAQISHPIVIEVEPPTTEIAMRRIQFYTRLGFILWENLGYCQPPYRIGEQALAMDLMTWGEIDIAKNFQKITENIYQNVYKVR